MFDALLKRAPGPHIVALALLAPTIPELLTTSTPPDKFFALGTFIGMVTFYGSGALLVRELACRWRKGWIGVALLGAAYGVLEEGLMLRTWFSTDPNIVGGLNSYGRAFGINWVWAAQLTVLEMAMAIFVPIALVHVAFPAVRTRAWLGRRGLVIVTLLLVLATLAGHHFLNPGIRVAPAAYAAAGVIFACLIAAARFVPARPWDDPWPGLGRPWLTWVIGSAAAVAEVLVIGAVLTKTSIPAVVTVAAALLVPFGAWALWRAVVRGRSWTDPELLGAAGGLLTVFLVLAPINELHPPPGKDEGGLTVVALAVVVLLVALGRRSLALRPLDG